MYEEDLLLTPLNNIAKESYNSSSLFINFLNKLEGLKTKSKNLHWNGPDINNHEKIDAFAKELSDFEDSIAEDFMGISGIIKQGVIKGIPCVSNTIYDFVREVYNTVETFYKEVPTDICYKGILSECDAFIHIINKYKYFFALCDNVNH